MFRASIETTGSEVDFRGIADAAEADASSIPGAGALVALVEAALARSGRAAAASSEGPSPDGEEARDRVRQSLGSEALVDAAAIIGNFERMNRIADATGIPLDAPVYVATESLRSELGIDGFGSAKTSKAVKTWQRALWRLIEPVTQLALRFAGRRSKPQVDSPDRS